MVSLVLTALAFGATLYVWFGERERLAEQVPIHWNFQGEPDRYVPREQVLPYLFILPGVMVGCVLLTLVLPWLSPRQYDVERFRPTYNFVMMLLVAIMGYLQAVSLAAMLQVKMDFNRVLLGGLFLCLALLGNVLGKVQRNFWIGVRTPWTLASETVWIRTHRLAAWLFVGGALAGFVGIMAGLNPALCFVLFGVPALIPVLYSLVLYKRLEAQGKL
jgi:uncharacterized membrane protein